MSKCQYSFQITEIKATDDAIVFSERKHHLLGVLENVLTYLNKTSGDSPL